MTHFTDANTEGYSDTDLSVLNGAYEAIIAGIDAEFEADTHAISDTVANAFEPGDTVETLTARVLSQNPSWVEAA